MQEGKPGGCFILNERMLRTVGNVSFAILMLFGVSLAAQKKGPPQNYQSGKIVDVQRKVNTKVLYYVVNTPITKDEPYFEISVQFKDEVYKGRYTPRHADEELPEEWSNGATIDGRVDGHHMYLKRPSGMEMDLYIAKHTAARENSVAPAQN